MQLFNFSLAVFGALSMSSRIFSITEDLFVAYVKEYVAACCVVPQRLERVVFRIEY
jgi:hypothetical protein